MSRTLQSALLRLLQAENQQLSLSQLTSGQRKSMEDFCTRTGAVIQQRLGRGSVYRVINRVVIEQHLSDMGSGVEPEVPVPQRAMNISRQRSSKSGQHAHSLTYLLAKGVHGTTWIRDDGEILNLERDTQRQGACVLTLGDRGKDEWVTEGTLWLVENQAVFDHLDWLPDNSPATIIWYRGQLQNSIIDWLAKRQRATSVMFFPDYDGVGLQNYLRLKQRLQHQLRLWLMPRWKEKLKQYGNNQLWGNSADEFESVAQQIRTYTGFDEPEVFELIRAMQTSGLALEQEAVWLPVQ